MIGYLLSFCAGLILTGAFLIPILISNVKRGRELETYALQSKKNSADFLDKTNILAAALIESAESFSVPDSNQGINGKDQARNIKNIENTIEENTKIVAEIFDKTNSVASIASKMENDVFKGFIVLEKNVKKMGDIKEKNSGVIKGIISLSNKVNKIRDIVRTINTITDQTKVIAFNAALEAASAGETGKRFAVVAGEVNRLADDIAVLTSQIREQVEEIQSSSSSLIIYSEEGSDRIAEGYKLIKDLENIFMEIKSGAEITSNQAQTITVSTQHQLKSSEQIHSDFAEVSQGVKHFIGISESAALSAGTLKERSSELKKFLEGKHGN